MEIPVLWFALLLLSCFWTINGAHYEDDFLDPSDLVNYDAVSQTMRKNTELIYSVLKKNLQRTLDEIQRLSLFPDMEKSEFLEAQRLTEILKLLEDKDVDPVILERELKKVQILHKHNIDSSWKSRIKDLVLMVLQDTFTLADMEKSKFLEAQQLTEIAKLLEDKDMDPVSLQKDLEKVLILHKQNIDSFWNSRIEDLLRVVHQNTIMLADVEKSKPSKISKLLEDKDMDPGLLERALKEVLVLHKQNIDTFWKSRIEDLVHVVLQNTFTLEDHGEEYRVTASDRMREAISLISKFIEDNAWDREMLEKDLKKVLLQLKQDQFLTWEKKYEETHDEEIQHGFLTPPNSPISKVLGHLEYISYIGPTVLFLLLFLMYALMPSIQNLAGRREERPNEDDQPREEARPLDAIPDDNIHPDAGNQEQQDEPENRSLTSLWPFPKQETQSHLNPQRTHVHREASNPGAREAIPKPLKSEKHREGRSVITTSGTDADPRPRERKSNKVKPAQKNKIYGDTSTSSSITTEPNQHVSEMDPGEHRRRDVEDISFAARSDEHKDHFPAKMKAFGTFSNSEGTPARKTECYEDSTNSSSPHGAEAESTTSDVCHGDQSQCNSIVSSIATQSNPQCDSFTPEIKSNVGVGTPTETRGFCGDAAYSTSIHEDVPKSLKSEIDSECSFNDINSATLPLDRVPEKIKNDTHAAGASRSDALYLRPVPLQSEMNHGNPLENQSHAFSNSYVTNFRSIPDAQDYSMCDVSHNTLLRDHDPTNRFSKESAQNSSTLGSQSFELIEESGQFSTDT